MIREYLQKEMWNGNQLSEDKGYLKCLAKLEKIGEFVIKPGLKRIGAIMEKLDSPEKKLKTIIVGGTNGKGTTCYKLEDLIKNNKLKVGCFTSPHLHTIRERFRVDGKIIEKEEFVKIFNRVNDVAKKNRIQITYFEITTAMAYLYFEYNKVDLAIMEVGMGGEFDAVNVGRGDIVVLTTLGLDHMSYLGDTIGEIGLTKGKIVRENSQVVTGWEKENWKYIPTCEQIQFGKDSDEWTKIVSTLLDMNYEKRLIEIPGRMEIYQNFILDGAHNVQAVKRLIGEVKEVENVIFSCMEDKDVGGMLSLFPDNIELFVCGIKNERGMNTKEIIANAERNKIECRSFESVEKAIEDVGTKKTLITGSFYCVSEARVKLKMKGSEEN